MEAMKSVDMENTGKPVSYDVFISHRGPDTKTSFVGYLYEALKARGLLTFLDCRSIEMGEDVWRSIENAIKNSKIAVVVFSENFASSQWCLKELDAILGTPGIKVCPIFYKVRPSEVGHPESGQLKTAFEKLSTRHEKSEIEHWKRRLKEASQRMGWELPCDSRRLEVDFLSDVVGKILAFANKRLPLNVGECVVGVMQVAKELVEILGNGKEVLLLGLWGMGGIGKSTLARELYNQMSPRYDSSCFIEDVSEVVHHGGIKTVQQQIMKDLCKNDPNEIDGKSKGKTILKERLSNIRFLLVLDDIQENDVMEHCVLLEMFTKGSMCIVTSRDKRLLTLPPSSRRGCAESEVYIHDVQGLNMANSKEVLKFHAFGDCSRINSEDEKLVSSISERCGGIPLVLKVIGAFLRGKEVKIWNEMVEKLSAGAVMDEKMLFKCLRISYDALSKEYQEMYLDIACALLGERKDYAVRIWKFGEVGIQTLVEKALITVDEEGLLKMHDLLRDMGREIERTNMERRRMWMPEALILLQRGKRLSCSLQTLNLSFGFRDLDTNKDRMIHLDVSHMTDLRIIVCNEQLKILSKLPRSTHWFSLTSREYLAKAFIPTISKYNELKILVLGCSYPKVYGLLNSMRELSKLEVLDLGKCTLHFHSWEMWNLSSTFGELSNLEVLDLSFSHLTMIPESFKNLKKIRELKLCDSKITRLSCPFDEFSNLEVLDLNHCQNLTLLPESIGGLKKLRNLQLDNLIISSLPYTFGELSNLEVLNMSSCLELAILPDSFGGLKKLRDLDLHYSGLKELPNTFGELSNLEVMNLTSCKNLTGLPESFGGLKKLRDLDLQCTGLKGLPNTFGELSNLEVLNLTSCKNLTRLPESFGGLKKLYCLQSQYSGIWSLPYSFGGLYNLEILDCSNSVDLVSLPHSFGDLKKIRELKLCTSRIWVLPYTFGGLSNLEVLNLNLCKELKYLPDLFGSLQKLRELSLYGMERLCNFPYTFGELSNLEVLNLEGCGNLTKLPDSFGCHKKLRDLRLRGTNIRNLPHTFVELSNLEMLDLSHIPITLPDSFGNFKKLHKLILSNYEIQILPETFGELSNLEVLDLSSCKNLTELPDSFRGLKKLQKLELCGSGITSLSNILAELSNLEVLTLNYCKNLTMLPDSFGGLKKLRILLLCYSGITRLPSHIPPSCYIDWK